MLNCSFCMERLLGSNMMQIVRKQIKILVLMVSIVALVFFLFVFGRSRLVNLSHYMCAI